MEAPKAPDRCSKCAQLLSPDHRIQCGLCKDAHYCSQECETAEFVSHRASCKVKERILAMQQECTVCTERIKKVEEHCDKCGGIKYCSVACKDADKNKHELICEACVNLVPRPTKMHRVCILFPADEESLRLVWVPVASDGLAVSSMVRDIVAHEIEYNAALNLLPDDEAEKYRDITLCFVENFAFDPDLVPNRSLGLATIGRPVESVKGNLLVLDSQYAIDENDEFVGTLSDATPADLPAVIDHFERFERMRGLGLAERMALMSREMQAHDSDEGSADGEAGQGYYDEGKDEDDDDDWETSGDERDS